LDPDIEPDIPETFSGVVEGPDWPFSVIDPPRRTLPSTLFLSWLTVSVATVVWKRVAFTCKIQVTACATFRAVDCTFKGCDDRTDCAVEIFAGSTGVFEHCYFHGGSKAAVVFREHAMGDLFNCNFAKSENTSVLVLDSSAVNIANCTFGKASKFSVYLYRDSRGLISKCNFFEQTGKSIFLLKRCACRVDECHFDECQTGAIAGADGCQVYVRASTFKDVQNTCVHGMKNCILQVENCEFRECHGNGVNFEFASGFVRNCSFTGFVFSPIAVFGNLANPVVLDCVVSDCETMAVVARDACTPIFERLVINNVRSNAFSISDFSCPIIRGCILTQIDGLAFSVFNGAEPLMFDNVIELNGKPALGVYTAGHPSLTRTLCSPENSGPPTANVAFQGVLKASDFVETLMFRDDEVFTLSFDEDFRHFRFDRSADDATLRRFAVVHLDQASAATEPVLQRLLSLVPDLAERSPVPFPPVHPMTNVPLPIPIEFHAAEAPPATTSRPGRLSVFTRAQDFEVSGFIPPTRQPQDLINVDYLYERFIRGAPWETETPICLAQVLDPQTGSRKVCGGKANRLCSPCGHLVLCETCAAVAAEAKANGHPHTCPVCQTPIQASSAQFREQTCCICLGAFSDTVITPCGHQAMCYACAVKMWMEKRQCPICCGRIISFRHQFPIFGPGRERVWVDWAPLKEGVSICRNH
jgi:hypothetical protein